MWAGYILKIKKIMKVFKINNNYKTIQILKIKNKIFASIKIVQKANNKNI